jgi:hypothetical protein
MPFRGITTQCILFTFLSHISSYFQNRVMIHPYPTLCFTFTFTFHHYASFSLHTMLQLLLRHLLTFNSHQGSTDPTLRHPYTSCLIFTSHHTFVLNFVHASSSDDRTILYLFFKPSCLVSASNQHHASSSHFTATVLHLPLLLAPCFVFIFHNNSSSSPRFINFASAHASSSPFTIISHLPCSRPPCLIFIFHHHDSS